MKRYKNSFLIVRVICLAFCTILFSCKKLVDVKAPYTSISHDNIFNSDQTAIAVLNGIYASLSSQNASYKDGGFSSISLFTGLCGDELSLYDLNFIVYSEPYHNSLTADSRSAADMWRNAYPIVYKCNLALDGLNSSSVLTPEIKRHLMGEVQFLRAFCYFYLVNIYGDVPLAVTTDYNQNAQLSRSNTADVYHQIINDLLEAREKLSVDFLDGALLNNTNERVRPTRAAADVLLARAFLYLKDYENAELYSSEVLSDPRFRLIPLNDVFLKNSEETIWQLQPTGVAAGANTGEGKFFILPNTGPSGTFSVYLSNSLIDRFETNDQRLNQWTKIVKVADPLSPDSTAYPYAYKYKVGVQGTTTVEYISVLRLAELYLIRAEARAQQNNIAGANDDLNAIRARAGLPNTTTADQASLLEAILHERQVELFTEWGHRWFDLKRMQRIDAVMEVEAQKKGGQWESYQQLFPIPKSEMLLDNQLVQNPGYN